jgi:hypothetical protein
MTQTLTFRCPRCQHLVEFEVIRARIDQDFIETTTFGEGPADPSYIPGPLEADVTARARHSC